MKLITIINFLLLIALFSNKITGAELFVSDSIKIKRTKKQIAFEKHLQELDKYYSDKKLGSFIENGNTVFRIFSTSAENISLVVFKDLSDEQGTEYEMTKDENCVWESFVDGDLEGSYYNYKVTQPGKEPVLCIDPYSKAIASYNTYYTPRKSLVVAEQDFQWDDDKWIQRDWRDLIIYEMHVRDMTIDKSSGVEARGTYKGLTELCKPGGLSYIKSLGINTVELLPSQEFANIESPYKDSLNGRYNSWNHYERNHWGYMTAAFFAPESYYSERTDQIKLNTWNGTTTKPITDFKEMVKAFHKEGIGVMMDVVYNHLSEYEIGNLKEIDKDYYFRLDDNGNYISQSGTGNDLKTERPMMRRMIIESILYWMKEYHIDGFRFDLGKLIDWKTIEEIIKEAKNVNPDVVFVCEPWGGGYDPAGFSLRGWGSWNDQIRNGVKGENPVNGLGWIFGKWYGNNTPVRIKSYVNGTLVRDSLGLFQKKEHSVNYLESHDGYTLGDFIRIGLGNIKPDETIKDVEKNAELTPEQLKLNKLGALFLLTSQGITMIHSGQEFARSKVIFNDVNVNDEEKGRLDHNSYNKDNETNYINYDYARMNADLVDYYKGLISLHNTYPAFRRARYEDITFYALKDNQFALGYHIKFEESEFIVLFNTDRDTDEEFHLPKGDWEVLVSPEKAGIESQGTIVSEIEVQPSAGYVLKKR
jgi:pullulanase/glycogen debranching enzyme